MCDLVERWWWVDYFHLKVKMCDLVNTPIIKISIDFVSFQDWCNQTVDIRSHEHRDKLALLRRELPPLMDQLLDILTLEKTSRFLPQDVASIVMKLIDIRVNFKKTKRKTSDYRLY